MITVAYCSEDHMQRGAGGVLVYLDMTEAHRFYLLEGRLVARAFKGIAYIDMKQDELDQFAISPSSLIQRLGRGRIL